MELLIMVYACRTSCARNIIGVVPYFPYSKQCKMRKRGSIVSKLLASMMCKAGKWVHQRPNRPFIFGFIRILANFSPPTLLLSVGSLWLWAGLTHLITMDLHQKEIQGFFNIPVDNLRASPFLLQYIQEEVGPCVTCVALFCIRSGFSLDSCSSCLSSQSLQFEF